MLPEEGQILTGPQFNEPVRVEAVKVEADYPNLFPTFGMLPGSGAAPNSTHLTAISMMRGEAN